MTANWHSDGTQVPATVADHWMLFLIEGVTLIVLGLLAIVIPSISTPSVTYVLGWLFLVSGAIGLATTFLGATGAGVLVVPSIGFACDSRSVWS